MIMEHANRFEAVHIGHEDIDDHQVERRIVESDKTIGAAVCDRDLETIALQPRANGEADMRIVVDDQNASHVGFSRRINYASN
jgi:hypothetical protein